MIIILVFVLIVITLLVVLFYQRKKSVEGFGMFYDTQKTFGDGQFALFQDKLGKSIFMNPGMSIDSINEALNQPSIYLPKTKDRKYDKYFAYDPTNEYESIDTSMCKAAKYPLDLPAREKGKRVDCGWYYLADPALPSFSVLGGYDGPLFPDKLPINGQWIWDLKLAAQLEDIKYCKGITACKALSVDEIRSKCAFCPNLGYMVPITAGGDQKYPDSDVGGCGLDVLTNVEDCNKPPPPVPVIAQNGTSCANLGKPSNDGSMRIYTKEECDTLGGTYYSSGECAIPTGGNYSWDCKQLNIVEAVAQQTIAADICAPNPQGNLTPECLISIATGFGYSSSGGLIRNLQQPNSLNDYDKQALKKLGEYGVHIPMNLFGKGDMDIKAANDILYNIFKSIKSSSSAISNSAKWLVNGSEIPDICDFEPNSQGPFPIVCLQREFRKAGCQASGAAYPNASNKEQFDKVLFGSIYQIFKDLYNKMAVQKSDIQDAAVNDCLGIQLFRPLDPYTYMPNHDHGGHDMQCFMDGQDADFCRKLCDSDSGCQGYNYVKPNGGWGARSGCCTKYRTTYDLSINPDMAGKDIYPASGVDFYKKNYPPSTYTEMIGKDHGGDDIACFTNGESGNFCKEKCDSDPTCAMYNVVKPPIWGGGGCCYKRSASPMVSNASVNAYVKQYPSYIYTKQENVGIVGSQLQCIDGSTVEELQEKCNANPNCKTISRRQGLRSWGCMTSAYEGAGDIRGGWNGMDTYFKTSSTYLGCFNDSADRAIPDHPSDRVNGDPVTVCRTLAKQRNDNTFGVQDKNECYTGTNPNYDKYGPAEGCGPNGGAWTQQVYSL